MVRGSKPVSPDQVPVPLIQMVSTLVVPRGISMPCHVGNDQQRESKDPRMLVDHCQTAQEPMGRTVEHGGVGAAEGGNSNNTLALDLALAEKLHAGAAGGGGTAWSTHSVRADIRFSKHWQGTKRRDFRENWAAG